MMHDQADELRQLVRARLHHGAAYGPAVPLVVVSGGKGGVGTTTVAANLAIALARQGRRAVFVDADLDHGGSARWGQHPDRGSIVDVLAGRRTLHEVLERGPSGIQVIAGAWASEESTEFSAAAQERFVTDAKNLSLHAEVVVIDAGSSRSSFVRRFWLAADAVLVVTTAESCAVMECYAATKVLLGPDPSVSIRTLVNLVPDATTAADVHARVAEACRKFLGSKAEAAGHIPPCEAGPSDEPVLIYPARSVAARALDRVADTLWAQLQLDAKNKTDPRHGRALSA